MRSAGLIAVLFLLACGPIGKTPGMRLGGARVATPQSFEFVESYEEIQLEAQGAVFPRVVNIWGIGTKDALYVWGDPWSGWVKRVAERPDAVRVRVGDQSFELRAETVTDPAQKQFLADAYQTKYAADLQEMYGRPTTVEDYEHFYRLTPR